MWGHFGYPYGTNFQRAVDRWFESTDDSTVQAAVANRRITLLCSEVKTDVC